MNKTMPTIIDVDTHLTEPKDLWTSRAPAAWKDRVPQVKVVDGKEAWVLDGKVIAGMRAHSSVLKDMSKTSGIAATMNTYDEVHESSWDAEARLKLMDQTGIWAQIVYPNLLGFGGGLMAQFDPDVKLICSQIYNDAMGDMQKLTDERILGVPIVPWWDLKEALKEIERCHAMGLRGININPNPHEAGLPDFAEDYWTPMFEMCADLEMPVNFHIGSSEDQKDWFGSVSWPSLANDQKLAIGGLTVAMQNMGPLSNLIMSGLAERHPKLKFVSVESGAGWIPFLLEGLDYSSQEMMSESAAKLTMLPSEYFKRQFFACFWFERQNIQDTIHQLGAENLLFETDYPHPTCLYPDAAQYVTRALEGLDEESKHKVLAGNASKLYNIPLPQSAAVKELA